MRLAWWRRWLRRHRATASVVKEKQRTRSEAAASLFRSGAATISSLSLKRVLFLRGSCIKVLVMQ